MTTMAAPGPPEHLTDATAGVGNASGDGLGIAVGVEDAGNTDDGLGLGPGCSVAEIAGLAAGEVSAVDGTAPHAIAIIPANATAAQRNLISQVLNGRYLTLVMGDRANLIGRFLSGLNAAPSAPCRA